MRVYLLGLIFALAAWPALADCNRITTSCDMLQAQQDREVAIIPDAMAKIGPLTDEEKVWLKDCAAGGMSFAGCEGGLQGFRKRDAGIIAQQQKAGRLLPGMPGYAHHWQTLQSDNGQVVKLDLNSIIRTDLGVEANVYIDQGQGGSATDFLNVHHFVFDCRGHIEELPSGNTTYAPPHSMGGVISELVCKS